MSSDDPVVPDANTAATKPNAPVSAVLATEPSHAEPKWPTTPHAPRTRARKRSIDISTVIAIGALTVSLSTAYLQFFWKSHDLRGGLVSLVDDPELERQHKIGAYVLIQNQGNQFETVRDISFIATAATINRQGFAELGEPAGPFVIKPGEAIIEKIIVPESEIVGLLDTPTFQAEKYLKPGRRDAKVAAGSRIGGKLATTVAVGARAIALPSRNVAVGVTFDTFTPSGHIMSVNYVWTDFMYSVGPYGLDRSAGPEQGYNSGLIPLLQGGDVDD